MNAVEATQSRVAGDGERGGLRQRIQLQRRQVLVVRDHDRAAQPQTKANEAKTARLRLARADRYLSD